MAASVTPISSSFSGGSVQEGIAAGARPPVFYNPNRVFYRVGGERLSQRMPVVREIFDRVLKPLYGPQDKAIGQIERSEDRVLYLLYDGNDPVGVLQFKTGPSDEFEKFGIRNSIEIKSLFVNQSQSNSGRGLGSALIQKLFEEAAKLKVSFSGFHVTVSEDKQESLRFFQKKGFQIVHTWDGRYHEGKQEHLLFRPAGSEAQKQANFKHAPRTQSFGRGEYPDEPELVHVIHNAHADDIHAFLRITESTYITGSKDNTIVEWDGVVHQQVQVVQEVEPAMESNEQWVMCLEKLNPGMYVSGTRNGLVDVWRTDGRHLKTIHVKTPRIHHKSMAANARRVNCLAAKLDPYVPGFFAGLPTQLDEVDVVTSRTEVWSTVHKNDWVFSIHPTDANNLLCAVGCVIQHYSRTQEGWEKSSTPFPEPDPIYIPQPGGKSKKQRAFIQAMTPLQDQPGQFVLARLNGHVEVIDVEKKSYVNRWSEHNGRVWCALPLTPQVITSSCEDKTIRIWDVRKKQSVHMITSSVGPINAMMKWDDHTLMAATSPLEKTEESCGAQIRIYDVRY
jgi:WD40 repeat protein